MIAFALDIHGYRIGLSHDSCRVPNKECYCGGRNLVRLRRVRHAGSTTGGRSGMRGELKGVLSGILLEYRDTVITA